MTWNCLLQVEEKAQEEDAIRHYSREILASMVLIAVFAIFGLMFVVGKEWEDESVAGEIERRYTEKVGLLEAQARAHAEYYRETLQGLESKNAELKQALDEKTAALATTRGKVEPEGCTVHDHEERTVHNTVEAVH